MTGPHKLHLHMLPLLAATFFLLVGCENMPIEDFSNVLTRKEPRVDSLAYVHAVAFAVGDDRLDVAERERLDAFVTEADVGYGDRVSLLTAAPEGLEGAGLAEQRRAAVAAYLAHRRIELEPAAGFGVASPARDTVAMVVRRYVVTLPGCPDWTDRPGRTFNNTPSRNWGCATAANLGLMVADPADLEAGRRPGPMDGTYGALAIERYRKGETKPLAPEEGGTVEMPVAGTASEGK